MSDQSHKKTPPIPRELGPAFGALRKREENRDRLLGRLRLELEEAQREIARLRGEVKETELRRVAEIGAVRFDLEEERAKSAQLREKLVKAENAKRTAARDVLDAKLFTTTQDAERKTLEREIADLKVEVERLKQAAEAAQAQAQAKDD